MADFLTAGEAARRLGVGPATLYAWRQPRRAQSAARPRTAGASLFNANEVERLARRAAAAAARGRGHHGRVGYHRDHSATASVSAAWTRRALAVSRTFEEVAEPLWTGELQGPRGNRGMAGPAALAAGRPGRRRAARLVRCRSSGFSDRPGDGGDRSAPAPARPGRRDRGRAEHHRRDGGDCLPSCRAGPQASPDGADRRRRGCGRGRVTARPARGYGTAVSTALVLLADHELAASTLAARVAASVHADPYAVVGTGLGAGERGAARRGVTRCGDADGRGRRPG